MPCASNSQPRLDDALAVHIFPLEHSLASKQVLGHLPRRSFPGSVMMPSLQLLENPFSALIDVLENFLTSKHVVSPLNDSLGRLVSVELMDGFAPLWYS